ncbi:hypothetical protein GGX14DRAFT_391267 [Mycena pura]|uniref:Uncharacterized protein n=1 Tax=Mycena pura TaxID=153505 RepID=A0AAD6VQ13_9AGAR|nr:hypothetical protein GGX14DRAFT_391267 [Mycena pura]
MCLSATGRRRGCVAARRSGRAAGGAVEGGVDVVWTAGGASFETVHPGNERDTAGVCCGHQRRRRGPQGERDGKRLVPRLLRECRRGRQRRERSETRRGFLLSGEAFVRKLALAWARRRKGDALARRSWFEAGGRELGRGGGEGGRARELVYTAENMGLGTAARLGTCRAAMGTARSRIPLAVGREDASAGGFWAANARRVDVHRVVVSKERHGVVSQGTVWKEEERRCLFDDACLAALSSASVQAPQGSRRQGAVPFPKRIRGRGGLSRVGLDGTV